MGRRVEEGAGHDRDAVLAHQTFCEGSRVASIAKAGKGDRRARGDTFEIRVALEKGADEAGVRLDQAACAQGEGLEVGKSEHREAIGRHGPRDIHDVARAADPARHLRRCQGPAAAQGRQPVGFRQAVRGDEGRRKGRGRCRTLRQDAVAVDLVDEDVDTACKRRCGRGSRARYGRRGRRSGCGGSTGSRAACAESLPPRRAPRRGRSPPRNAARRIGRLPRASARRPAGDRRPGSPRGRRRRRRAARRRPGSSRPSNLLPSRRGRASRRRLRRSPRAAEGSRPGCRLRDRSPRGHREGRPGCRPRDSSRRDRRRGPAVSWPIPCRARGRGPCLCRRLPASGVEKIGRDPAAKEEGPEERSPRVGPYRAHDDQSGRGHENCRNDGVPG